MKLNNCLVFDLETGGLDTRTCQILEIAAIAVDPISWTPIKSSEFHSLVRPDDEETLEAGAMAVNKIPIEELRKAPSAKAVFARFTDHVRRFGGKTTSVFTAPFPAGKNIKNFDLPIMNRYCERFKIVDTNGVPKLFNRARIFDLDDDGLRWLGQTHEVDSISMDTLRDFFGISQEGAHTAIIDCAQTAWLICKFQRLYRELATKIKFKGSAKGVDFSKPESWF